MESIEVLKELYRQLTLCESDPAADLSKMDLELHRCIAPVKLAGAENLSVEFERYYSSEPSKRYAHLIIYKGDAITGKRNCREFLRFVAMDNGSETLLDWAVLPGPSQAPNNVRDKSFEMCLEILTRAGNLCSLNGESESSVSASPTPTLKPERVSARATV